MIGRFELTLLPQILNLEFDLYKCIFLHRKQCFLPLIGPEMNLNLINNVSSGLQAER